MESDRDTARDPKHESGLQDRPWYGAVMHHLDSLWTRGVRERWAREAKWARNQLTSEADLAAAGDSDVPDGDGGWRRGDGKNRETLRVARQKVVAARSAIGDAVYRGNRVPFLLSWRNPETARMEGAEDALQALRSQIDHGLIEAAAADVMRVGIETAAAYGEYWLHGTLGMDAGAGAVRPSLEAPSPWEMYFDDVGPRTDLQRAEYVIRRRWMSPWEVEQLLAGDAGGLLDEVALREVIDGATHGGHQGGAGGSTPTAGADPGRARRDASMVEVREVWAWVPARLFAADGAGVDAAPDVSRDRPGFVAVMALVAGARLVGLVFDPGPRPYFRGEWDRDPMRAEPQGLLDALESTQTTLTGVVRAWLSNLRRASRILLAGHRDNLTQDVSEIIEGVDWIDVDPDTRSVRDALEQVALQDLTEGLVRAIQFLQEFADLESHVPRIQQGQQPVSDSTAYELRQRLAASGKYLNEIVRRHDGGIVWAVNWWLYVLGLIGAIDAAVPVEVQPRGFSNFQELVARLEGLLRLLGLGAQSPEANGWLRHDYLIRQVATADDLDPAQALLTAEEHAQRAAEAAQSEERALQLADARAKVAKTEAEAERARADAASKSDRGTLDRARFVRDVEHESMGVQPGEGMAG